MEKLGTTRYTPLPIPIPGDYDALLECDASHIYHVNAGRKRFRDDQVHKLMEAAESDPRLSGLTILHLRQELEPFWPYACKLCPRDQKKAAKKKTRRSKK